MGVTGMMAGEVMGRGGPDFDSKKIAIFLTFDYQRYIKKQ